MGDIGVLHPVILASKRCSEAFDLAAQWTQNHVSEGKADEAGGGTCRRNDEVRHRHVDQDVVQMRPQLLILKSARNSEEVDGRASNEQDEHQS